MKIVIDIEANALENPTEIWVIVCKDIDTGERYIFRNVTSDEKAKRAFLEFGKGIVWLIGHNILEYDLPVLARLISFVYPVVSGSVVDTLVISKLVDYSRDGHSIEAYGELFEIPKGKFVDFSKYSKEMEDYCVRDVDICERIYRKYLGIIDDKDWRSAIDLEQRFQCLVNSLHDNGFAFNRGRAEKLLTKVTEELADLDKDILGAFPPKEVLIREFTPKLTKFGTISRTSVPRSLHHNIHLYKAGEQYRHTSLVDFNPASHKQVIAVLNEAGWQPTDKTQTHIDTEREISRLKYTREENKDVEVPKKEHLAALNDKLNVLKTSGWKINENNLSTLPEKSPKPARLLAKRILLESRRRTLTEWLSLVQEDDRIHGRFYGIGAWTHRMAHQKPNTANIPSEFREDGSVKLLGKEMRTLWQAPRNRLLVGVDAEGIQLRIFAHYIQDEEFTYALVAGKKADKTDPHSLNQRILGSVCKTRQAAKRFIYALLLGAGGGKLSQVLGASAEDTQKALDRLLERYEGFAKLKSQTIPKDAKNGYFLGLDNRRVPIPGDTESSRRHLCMSGYLQNGEAVVLKRAALIFHEELNKEEGNLEKIIWLFVNMVHDEYITEVPNDMKIALRVAEIKADAIRKAGEFYKLRCPLAGSYYSEDRKDYTIGTNWYVTH